MSVFIKITVGEADPHFTPQDALVVATAAQRVGLTGIIIGDAPPWEVDSSGTSAGLDPSVTAAYLAGQLPDLPVIVEATTTHNAPYNLARRIGSLHRATDSRAGLLLRAGDGDEVSDAVAPDPAVLDRSTPHHTADERGERWTEYASILQGLWRSFPHNALLGDQQRGIVADDSLIRPIAHEGRFYRVSGPLDGPDTAAGTPPLFATDVERIGWPATIATADAIIVDRAAFDAAQAAVADAAQAGEADAAGHHERAAVIVRVHTAAQAPPGADGILVELTGDITESVAIINSIPAHWKTPGRSLRESLRAPSSTQGVFV